MQNILVYAVSLSNQFSEPLVALVQSCRLFPESDHHSPDVSVPNKLAHALWHRYVNMLQQHYIVKFPPHKTYLKENLFIGTLHVELWDGMKTYPEYLQLLELNLDWNMGIISYHYQ